MSGVYLKIFHINFGEKWMDKGWVELSLKSLHEQGLYISQTYKKRGGGGMCVENKDCRAERFALRRLSKL